MSSEITQSGSDCCNSGCSDTTVSQVPGPQGEPGTNGEDGTDGHNAYTTTNLQFTQPAVNADVSVQTDDSAWMVVGQIIYIENGGYYRVVTDTFNFPSVKNLGYTGNAAPATIIPSSSKVSPGGLVGATGASGVSSLDDISPTTSKGDIIVDNGANSPNASDVRLGVGTDGQALVADASQPTGLIYATITPNAATDNAVARYDGATGTPIPLQTSKVIVTDDGAVQASGSGGNARGTYAVDLQTVRSAATQVASADYSVIAGGDGNTASNNNSTVAGGHNNVASGLYSGVAGGKFNEATGTNSTVTGGDTNTASGAQSAVSGGDNNTASGDWSFIPGGRENIVSKDYASACGVGAQSNKFGEQAFSIEGLNGPGSCQRTELLWSMATTTNTADVEMFLDGVGERATIDAGRTWAFEIYLAGRSQAGVCAGWTAKGVIQNNSGAVTMVAAATIAMIADGTGGTWGVTGNFTVNADNANDCLHLGVTGAVATNIHWTAHAVITQVAY